MLKEQLGNKKEILEIKNMIAKIKSATEQLEEKESPVKQNKKTDIESMREKSRETIFIICIIGYLTDTKEYM